MSRPYAPRMLEPMVDVKDDPINVGDLITYAVITDYVDSDGEISERKLINQPAIVIGSHYGGKGYTLYLNVKRIDGRRIGKLTPEKVDVNGIEVWKFYKVAVISSSAGENVFRADERNECIKLVNECIYPGRPKQDEWVNEMLEHLRGSIMRRGRKSKVSVDDGDDGHEVITPLRRSRLSPTEDRLIFDKKPVHDSLLTKLTMKRRRSECPKCGWAMVPVDEYGNRDKDGKVYQCLKDDCKYREEV